jgi:hypothetical protein
MGKGSTNPDREIVYHLWIILQVVLKVKGGYQGNLKAQGMGIFFLLCPLT